MRVTFAYPSEVDGKSYAPDSTADLPEPLARRLVHDGRARKADPPKKPADGDEKKKG